MTDRLTVFTNILQEHGFRLTASRQAIIASLVASDGHVSADELADLVHLGTPGCSLAAC